MPTARANETAGAALLRQSEQQARVAAAATSTTISWITFIPQARIDAPPMGCSYGSGYQFGGDNHTAFDWTSSRYRTALHGTVTWSSKAFVGNKAVGASHVYKKSTGKLVATKTASTANMSSKKLGSSSSAIDIRMVNHASNPFCSFGAIDGAITITLHQNRNWEIRSGTYRRMPNNFIYIFNGGKVSNVLTDRYQSAYCLIGPAACDEANLTGYYGTFS